MTRTARNSVPAVQSMVSQKNRRTRKGGSCPAAVEGPIVGQLRVLTKCAAVQR